MEKVAEYLIGNLSGIGISIIIILLFGKLWLDKLIDTKAQKSITKISQQLAEKISRRDKAYDYLLARQYEFFDKFSDLSGKLIKAIQNMKFELIEITKGDLIISEKSFMLKKEYMDACEEMDRFSLRYIHYIDMPINLSMQYLMNKLSSFVNVIDCTLQATINGNLDIKNKTLIDEEYRGVIEDISKISGMIKEKIEKDAEEI